MRIRSAAVTGSLLPLLFMELSGVFASVGARDASRTALRVRPAALRKSRIRHTRAEIGRTYARTWYQTRTKSKGVGRIQIRRSARSDHHYFSDHPPLHLAPLCHEAILKHAKIPNSVRLSDVMQAISV